MTASGDAAAGAVVWESAGCGTCHTLAAAGATGTTGPNLDADEFKAIRGYDVVFAVTWGFGPTEGGMPAFGDQLSKKQIEDVAAYVVQSTSG